MDFKEIKVLWVHDEVHNLQAFKATFRRDFKVFIAESGKEALKIFKKEDLNIRLTDQRMPEMTGIELTIQMAFEVFALRRENKELLNKLEKANDQLEFLLRQRLQS